MSLPMFDPTMRISKFHFKSLSILKTLPAEEVKWLLSNSKTKKVRSGYELFREGSYPSKVFILKKGKVKIFQTTLNGDEQIAYIYEPGDIFGYRPLISNEKHPVTAKALEESTLIFISRSKFQELLESSVVFSHLLLKNLSSEFSVWINYITTFAQYSVKERLALSLLVLAEKYKRSKDAKKVEINLSRKDLASFAATSIETLARVLTKWKNEKIISIRKRNIIISDPERLARIVDL
jgi:CRP-like cAMP-binding protein